MASKEQSVGSNLCLLKSVGAAGWQPTGFEGHQNWHQKSSVGPNLRLLKSVGVVSWQPTGFEDVSTGIKRAVST